MEQMLMNIVPHTVTGSKIRQKFKNELINSPPFIYSKQKYFSPYKKLFHHHVLSSVTKWIYFVERFCF